MPEEPISDPVFGELDYEPPLEEWYARIALTPGHRIDVKLMWSEERNGPFIPILERAREAFKLFQAREAEHRESLADAMIELGRESFPPDTQLPPALELARSLSVDQLSISPDGSMMVYYKDDTELFADHYIVVDIAPDGTFKGFTLQG